MEPTVHTSSTPSSTIFPHELQTSSDSFSPSLFGRSVDAMLGVLFALSAAIGFGATAVFARLSVQHMRPTTGTLMSLVVGTIVMLTIALALEGADVLFVEPAVYPVLFLAGFTSFIGGRLLNFVAVSKIGVSRSSPIVGASPLVATVLAVILAGESVNMPIVLGTVAIVLGLGIVLSQ